MNKNLLWAILLFFFILAPSRVDAQTFAGISMNIGNRLSFSPESDGLSRPGSISGSLFLRIQEEISEKWALQYGFDLGVLGYKLKLNTIDTLAGEGPPTVFSEYSTFYLRFNLLAGRRVAIKEKEMIVAIGGGATYYFSFSPTTTYNSGVLYPDGTIENLFSGSITSPSTNLLPFVKISTQLRISLFLTVGFEYTHHFSSMVNGTYEFFHTSEPSSGRILLVPGEFSLIGHFYISRLGKYF